MNLSPPRRPGESSDDSRRGILRLDRRCAQELIDERRAEDAADALAAAEPPVVSPQSATFFSTLTGHRLHVRVETPVVAKKATAGLLFVHRLGSHANRGPAVSFARKLARAGIVTVSLDLVGHGYSQGAPCEISSYDGCVTDIELCVDILFHGNYRFLTPPTFQSDLRVDMLRQIADLPFLLAGESTGAALAALAAMRLRTRQPPAVMFLGMVMLAPCLQPAPPPGFLEGLGALLGAAKDATSEGAKAAGTDRYNKPELLWATSGLRRRYGAEDTLAWKGALPKQTFDQVEHMLRRLQSLIPLVDFPFMVLADPDDKLCPPSAVQDLVRRASTPPGLDSRRVEALSGAMHDPLAHSLADVVALVVEFTFNLKMQCQDKFRM